MATKLFDVTSPITRPEYNALSTSKTIVVVGLDGSDTISPYNQPVDVPVTLCVPVLPNMCAVTSVLSAGLVVIIPEYCDAVAIKPTLDVLASTLASV